MAVFSLFKPQGRTRPPPLAAPPLLTDCCFVGSTSCRRSWRGFSPAAMASKLAGSGKTRTSSESSGVERRDGGMLMLMMAKRLRLSVCTRSCPGLVAAVPSNVVAVMGQIFVYHEAGVSGCCCGDCVFRAHAAKLPAEMPEFSFLPQTIKEGTQARAWTRLVAQQFFSIFSCRVWEESAVLDPS